VSPAAIAGFQPASPVGTICAACTRPIADYYFEAFGKIVCPNCQQMILASEARGPGAARFFKAAGFGLGAVVAGAAIWFSVALIPNSRLYALGAVFLGLIVGAAVRAGSSNRGGVSYQLLAVGLTYLGIGATHAMYGEWKENGFTSPASRIALVIVLGSVLAPVFVAIGNIFGVFVVGFSLFEAWRMNRRQRVAFNGPYRVAPIAAPASVRPVPMPAPPHGTWPPPAGGA
jgi:hypothetical protein